MFEYIYDMFSEDDYRDKFSKAMKRGLYKDSMYSFGKTLKRKEVGVVEDYINKLNNDKDSGLTIIQQKNKWKVKPNGEWLSFTGTEVKDLLKRNIFKIKLMLNILLYPQCMINMKTYGLV